MLAIATHYSTTSGPPPMGPEKIVENLQTAVLILDNRLRIVQVNPAFEVVFGASFRQIRGMLIDKLFGADSELTNTLRLSLAQQQPLIQHHAEIRLADGSSTLMHCHITPVADGPNIHLVAELHTSLSQQLIVEEEDVFARQQANQMMLRGLAHEIKNPLGGVRGAAQLLQEELLSEEMKEYTRIIIDEADRLTNLVNRMLSPTLTPNRRTTNIHQVLERVLALTASGLPASIELRRDYDPSIPALFSDEDQLIQVFLNLVRNAIQALQNGQEGQITLKTRIARRVTIGQKPHRQLVQIDVLDNGAGIPKEIQKQAFLPLVTTRAEGSGLGLSIAQSLITSLGGLIKFTSKPGQTKFTVLLPVENNE